MVQLPQPRVVGAFMALLIAAMSVFVSIMVNVDMAAHPDQQAPADLMSAMQGVVHVDRFGANAPAPLNRAPQAKPKVDPSDVVLAVSRSVTSASRLQHVLQFTSHQLAERLGVKTTGGFFTTILLVVFLLVLSFLLCVMLGITCPFLRSQQRHAASHNQTPKDMAAALEQREKMLAHTSPLQSHATLQSSNRMYQRGVPPGGGSEAFLHAQNMADITRSHGGLTPQPREIAPYSTSPRQSMSEQHQRESVKPPPLCPTLVMPMSEALLGIQMYELAQLSAEGQLNIVGVSGKPLLRANVKKVGNSRTLEIAMPEANSIPRATIAPAINPGASPGQQSRALEIRGMRGVFYGLLEMRSSGACYVVKDGQTVLTIDGDAESLQLALKSSVGLQLASVRCSTELFNDVDHVEIRVEAGVDTVLVLSVVLAVLLLSPYLPPVDA